MRGDYDAGDLSHRCPTPACGRCRCPPTIDRRGRFGIQPHLKSKHVYISDAPNNMNIEQCLHTKGCLSCFCLCTGCSSNIVFFPKNSRKFATSPSPALGCYWLYKKLPANRSDCTLALR